MSALVLVLVVGLVFFVIAFSPRVAARFSDDASRQSLRSELDALEQKKEMLRQMKTPASATQARQPPAA